VFKSNLLLSVLEWTPEGNLEMRGGTSPLWKKGVSLPAGAVWFVQPMGNGFGGGGLGGNVGGGAGFGGAMGGPPMPPKGKGKAPAPPVGLGAQLQGEDLKGLLTEMRKQSIPGLSLFAQAISVEEMEKVLAIPGMKSLAFQYHPHVTDEHLARLSKGKDLSTLILHETEKLTDKGYAHLAKVPRLRTLSLAGVQVSDTTLAALKEVSTLQSLHLAADTRITSKGLADLRSLAKLERLDLAFPVDAPALQSLVEHPKLTTLRLNAAKLEGKALAPLAKSTTLRSLTLDTQYQLSPPRLLGVRGEGKLFWSSATQLGFGGGGLIVPPEGKAESTFSAGALEPFTELRELVLLHPSLKEADLASLAKLSNLQRLRLFAPDYGDAGMEHLEKLKNLEYLDLSGTSVTPRLIKTLAKLPKLKTVRVNLLPADPKGKAALNAWRTGLPRVQIRTPEVLPGMNVGGGFGG
jgi:hypothetical protein